MDREMSGDKRDGPPIFDIQRLFRDLGGDRSISDTMMAAGLPFWELKTVQARRRGQNRVRIDRLMELLHVYRLSGRTIRLEHYIEWSLECKYPPSSNPDLPQPMPVSHWRV